MKVKIEGLKDITIFVSGRPNKDIHTRCVGLDIQLKSVDLWLLTIQTTLL